MIVSLNMHEMKIVFNQDFSAVRNYFLKSFSILLHFYYYLIFSLVFRDVSTNQAAFRV